MDFEAAAAHQLRLDWLEELEEYRFALEGDGGDRSWLILLPGSRERTRVLQPVARGRVLERREVVWEGHAWRDAVEDVCYAVRVAELRAPAVLSPGESVPSVMVRRWLEEGSPDGVAVDLTALDVAGAVEALARAG